MKKLFLTFLLLGLGGLGAQTAAAQQNQDVQIKTTRIAGNVYMLEGMGGNIGVSVGEDGILIIDDQFAPMADKIRAALKELNQGKLRFVLNTHWHGDHTGGNVVFGKESTIIAHDNVRKRLSVETTILGDKVPPTPKEGLPVITFDKTLSVHFNGEEIKAIHFPNGHTDGDSVIFFTKSNVVHMGDNYFRDRFPFVDLNHGGSVQGLIRNIGEIIKQLPADVKIIPGHGPLATLDDLKRYHQALIETSTVVETAMKAGKSLDQIKKDGLPEKWKSWGTGFIKTEQWIDTIYNSAQKK